MKCLCRRVVAIVAVLLFVGGSMLTMTASAATTEWTSPNKPDWQAYGFTSYAEYQKAINLGYFIKLPICKNANSQITSSFDPVYKTYGYDSQSAYEAALDAGTSYSVYDSSSSWYFGLSTADGIAATMCDPEIGVPIAVAAELMGVKFGSNGQVQNFISAYYNYLHKSSALFPDATELNNWKKIMTVTKNGFVALTSAAMSSLTDFVKQFAGKEITTVTAMSGITFTVNYGTPVTHTYSQTVSPNEHYWNLEYNKSYQTAVLREDYYEKCLEANEFSGSMNITTAEPAKDGPVGSAFWGGGADWIFTYTYTCITPGKSCVVNEVQRSPTETGVVTNDLGNATDVINGATSLNPSYPNTWDATADAPPYVCDPTKTGSIADTVGIDAGTIAGNPAIPVADTTAADTTVAVPVDTPIDTTGDLTDATTDIDWSPLENITLYDKFPFSLPWDLKNIATSLVSTPAAPKWVVDIPMDKLHLPDFSFTIDFSKYQVPVLVIRWGILLVFTGGLAFATYKLIKH